jgi:type I restriction enzyme S subunit
MHTSNEADTMKKGKRTLTPKLRFPEFRDGPGWKERPLSEVLSEHGHKSAGSEQVFSVSVHKGLVNQIEHLGRSFSAASTDHYNRVLPGDIVYTKSPTGDFPLGIVKQSKLGFPVIVSPLYGVFSPETTGLGVMLDAYFESPANAKIFLEPLVQKGAKNTINIKNSRFLSGTLILPVNKDEQRTIGDFLTSIDKLIAAEDRALQALKDHKKGLMQQLFPQPGQTQPLLRFPEFRDKGEWEEAKLGQLGKLISGLTYSPRDVRDDGLLVLRSSNIQNGEIALDDCVYVTPTVKGANLARPNDILICVRNGSKPLIGKNAMIPDGMPKCTHGAFMTVLRAHAACFVFQLLQTSTFQKQVAADLGATINSINGSNLLKYKFFVPTEPLEKDRIADCLTALDTRIAAQAAKIESLKQHKRGLMQQLFPSPEEQ